MKINLQAFCRSLNAAEERETVPFTQCNSYLIEHIIRPYLSSKKILVRDIDFERFDLDDVHDLYHIFEERDRVEWKLRQLAERAWKLQPQARTVRSFC